MELWAWWILVAIAFFAGEILTTGFFLMWLGIGALIGAAISFLGLAVPLQILGFIVSATGLMFSSRKLFKQLLGDRFAGPKIASNVDALIDKTGTVLKDVDNRKGGGLVKLRGEIWSALGDDDQPIAKGKRVIVIRVEGVKLVVMEQP